MCVQSPERLHVRIGAIRVERFKKIATKYVCFLAGFEQFGWSGSTKQRQKLVFFGVFLNWPSFEQFRCSGSKKMAAKSVCFGAFLNLVLSNSGGAAQKNEFPNECFCLCF